MSLGLNAEVANDFDDELYEHAKKLDQQAGALPAIFCVAFALPGLAVATRASDVGLIVMLIITVIIAAIGLYFGQLLTTWLRMQAAVARNLAGK